VVLDIVLVVETVINTPHIKQTFEINNLHLPPFNVATHCWRPVFLGHFDGFQRFE